MTVEKIDINSFSIKDLEYVVRMNHKINFRKYSSNELNIKMGTFFIAKCKEQLNIRQFYSGSRQYMKNQFCMPFNHRLFYSIKTSIPYVGIAGLIHTAIEMEEFLINGKPYMDCWHAKEEFFEYKEQLYILRHDELSQELKNIWQNCRSIFGEDHVKVMLFKNLLISKYII
jgi:hypothetical protein